MLGLNQNKLIERVIEIFRSALLCAFQFNSKKFFQGIKISLVVLGFVLLSQQSNSQVLATSRANSLEDGMNLSYLEQYWLGTPGINYSDYLNWSLLPGFQSQLALMKTMGFETLRLPVTFDKWENGWAPYTIDSVSYFYAVDCIVNWCNLYGLNLIIDYHHGKLDDAGMSAQLPRITQIWQQVATHYASTDPNKVLFEIFNEPNNINDVNWKNAAISIVNAIRPILPNHTFIVGANDYNSLYQLYNMGRLPDTNIIYTFHFYEPMIFTHQGATWIGDAVSTTGVPFPYDPANMPPINPLALATVGFSAYNYFNYPYQGTCQAVNNSLVTAKNFALMNNVPVWCGEFGSFNWYDPPDDSRCRYTECVMTNMRLLGIPYAIWEWDAGFSLFDGPPSLSNLSVCMQNALGLTTNPLPVKLIHFGGYNENDKNILQWVTSSEVNNSYFDIEISGNGSYFERIGSVAGNGTTSTQHYYSFIDKNAPEGVSYYRLKQVDYNGEFQFSNVISIDRKTKNSVSKIYPNPSRNFIQVSSGEYNWEIVSADLGAEIMKIDNTNKVDISTLNSGMYIVKLYNNLNVLVSTQKFVKE